MVVALGLVLLGRRAAVLRQRPFLLLRRHWRGPTWINSAWLLWLGLVRLGYAEAAAEMATRLGRAIAEQGLREYYDPFTGAGMGATGFSWSALVMELVEPDPAARTSHVGSLFDGHRTNNPDMRCNRRDRIT